MLQRKEKFYQCPNFEEFVCCEKNNRLRPKVGLTIFSFIAFLLFRSTFGPSIHPTYFRVIDAIKRNHWILSRVSGLKMFLWKDETFDKDLV